MRTILFRGQLIESNEWVEGFYAIKGEGTDIETHCICTSTLESNGSIPYFYLTDHYVKPETVGQFTGLTDKNGVKIFEGKISLEIVGCGIGAAEILIHEGQWQIYEQSQGYYPLFKAIGNDSIIIHDNPELLTK